GAAQLLPGRGPVASEEEDGAGLTERARGAGRMADELLPDPFTQRHLGEFALVAQPLFDVAEGEGRAGLGAADGFGEVGVPTAPVADGGADDPGQPADAGGGHLGGPVRTG